MYYEALKSKIHRATVTDANIEYEGSITIDADLMEAADLKPYELVHVWDVTNGERLTTYVIPPLSRGTGEVCINGSAAHKVKKGHIVIITSFAQFTPEELEKHEPKKYLVDENNKIVKQI